MNHALTAAAALVMLAGAAAAQPRTVRVQPDEPARHGERQVREHSREGDRDVQRNRQRLTRETPDADNAPGETDERPDADKPERRPPFQAHANALRALNRAADAALHLTDEQSEQIRAVMQAHRAARQEFMREHAEEIQQLREQARRERAAMPASERDAAGDSDGTGAPTQPLTRSRTERDAREAQVEDAPRARRSGRSPAADKLRAVLESAPFEAEMTKRLLRILTEEQRAHVQQTLAPRRPADAGPDRPARQRRGVEVPGHEAEHTEHPQGIEDVHIEVRWDD